MSKLRVAATSAFAVVRVDTSSLPEPDGDPLGPSVISNGVEFTVKEIVLSHEEAVREVTRLNDLAREKGCRYHWTGTRLFNDGGSFGRDPNG